MLFLRKVNVSDRFILKYIFRILGGAEMNLAVITITLALVFYTIGVFSERRSRGLVEYIHINQLL